MRRPLFRRKRLSFRQKLALSIAAATLIAAFIEGALDVFFDYQVSRFQEENTDLLSQETATIAFALDFSGDEVLFDEVALSRLEPDTRFRLLRDEEVVLSSPEPFPEDNNAWAVREGFVGGEYRLEIARPTSGFERLVLNELFLDLLDLPLFFALALAVAWALTRFALQPVRELTAASQEMAQQHFPGPIRVPPGGDELSQMAESFNRMRDSIQTLLERERAFTRYASHELRTPLSAFKVQLEALDMGLSPQEQVIPVLERNIARMEAVLAALLALARSDERDPEPAALQPLLQEMLMSFPADARARLTLRGTPATVTVADARLVYQAVRNLLENALRYSSGPVTLTVARISQKKAPALVALRVRDQGPGVPEAVLGTLTRPFFRLGDHSESLGLGLALVESISRSLSGKLELKNCSPGLEATLTLPTAGTPQPGGKAAPAGLARRGR